ncbi:MAG: gluconokinase [Chitinophagaceae bacterium]|nr:MAG: gluconokinase [Chitinophagaceae bacterium]
MEIQPAIIFIMGVSGSGKTTVGLRLSAISRIPFFDADDYHPEANKLKMKAGQPLNDDDRQGWLLSLNALARQKSLEKGAIIACSALKEKYRETLAREVSLPVYWVLLKGSFELIKSRISKRKDHFMPSSLLQSQFDTLEDPTDGIVIDVAQDPGAIARQIVERLRSS